MFENKLTLTNFKPTKFGLKVRGGRGVEVVALYIFQLDIQNCVMVKMS